MCVGRERRFAVCFSKIYELMQIAHAGSSCMCVRLGCLRHSNEFEESISEVDISDSLMSIPLISDVYDSSVEIPLSEVCSLHGVLFDIRMSLVPPQKD
jgi:hypothetical protein